MEIEKLMLEKMFDIPFENSHVQTDSVIEDSLTPERAYRNLGLRFMARWNDLKICSIKRRQAVVKAKQLKQKIEKEPDPLEKELLELELEELTAGWAYEDKLANDCKQELMHLLTRLKQLPCYDREDFENADVKWLEMKQNKTQPTESVLMLMNTGEALARSDKPRFELPGVENEIKALLDNNFGDDK